MNSKVLVGLQFFAIFIIILPKDSHQITSYWWMFALNAVIFGSWIFFHNRIGNFNVVPDIKESAKLITTGPYRYIRHPMYFSLIVFMLAIVLKNFCIINLVSLLVMIVAVILKAIKEERLWIEHHMDYREYYKNSKMIIPFIF